MSTASTQRKLQARQFIAQNPAAALATSSKRCKPDVAVVYSVADEDLNVYFSTRIESRKYQNIDINPKVAMSFCDENRMSTIQLTGIAACITNIKEEQDIFYRLMTVRRPDPTLSLPVLQLFEHGATSQIAIFKIVPKEMTLADFSRQDDGRYKPFFQKII